MVHAQQRLAAGLQPLNPAPDPGLAPEAPRSPPLGRTASEEEIYVDTAVAAQSRGAPSAAALLPGTRPGELCR